MRNAISHVIKEPKWELEENPKNFAIFQSEKKKITSVYSTSLGTAEVKHLSGMRDIQSILLTVFQPPINITILRNNSCESLSVDPDRRAVWSMDYFSVYAGCLPPGCRTFHCTSQRQTHMYGLLFQCLPWQLSKNPVPHAPVCLIECFSCNVPRRGLVDLNRWRSPIRKRAHEWEKWEMHVPPPSLSPRTDS